LGNEKVFKNKGVEMKTLTRKNNDAMSAESSVEIHGIVKEGFEAVREAFAENSSKRREVGAACCLYHKGEKVVDLWDGVRNVATGELWEKDTMALVYSATKGLSAMTLAIAHSRGWLDYDAPKATKKGRIHLEQIVNWCI
jgi:CubicO group peptidase (beta-lactamase class C family)